MGAVVFLSSGFHSSSYKTLKQDLLAKPSTEEVLALRQGINFTFKTGILYIEVESDSLHHDIDIRRENFVAYSTLALYYFFVSIDLAEKHCQYEELKTCCKLYFPRGFIKEKLLYNGRVVGKDLKSIYPPKKQESKLF